MKLWLVIKLFISVMFTIGNRSGHVMVTMLPSSAVDRGYYKICICCFSAKQALLRSKNKHWLARIKVPWISQHRVLYTVCTIYGRVKANAVQLMCDGYPLNALN